MGGAFACDMTGSRAIAANNTQPYVMVDNYITLCRNILSFVTRPLPSREEGPGEETNMKYVHHRLTDFNRLF